MVLNTGPLDSKSSALTTRPLLHTQPIAYITFDYCHIQKIKNNETLVENIINILKTNTDSNFQDNKNTKPVEKSPEPT